MSEPHRNTLGQPIGFPLPDWRPRSRPPRTILEGRFCRVEPLEPERHAAELFAANSDDAAGRMWTYMAYGPFASLATYRETMERQWLSEDPLFHTIIDAASKRAVGLAALMRIDPSAGTIEVGSIAYSPRLQRHPAATEAMFLLMRRVFDELGYRRYEWKCDSLNAASRAAALRLGFTFEGIFRQATVYKQRNRDTAWFSILDREWPAIKAGFETWLDPSNFDAEGRQLRSLAQCRAARH